MTRFTPWCEPWVRYVLWQSYFEQFSKSFFGKQRQLGRRSDNPDIRTLGYNSNIIRIERSISCQSGNTRGRKDKKKAWAEVTDEKLGKRYPLFQVQRELHIITHRIPLKLSQTFLVRFMNVILLRSFESDILILLIGWTTVSLYLVLLREETHHTYQLGERILLILYLKI